MVSLHRGSGWGSVELTGRGEQRRLQVSLPAGWLARVWAAGLALAGRHLVVAVQRAGWPGARVLALRAPGTAPVPLDVHASDGQHGDGQHGDGQHGDGQHGDGQHGDGQHGDGQHGDGQPGGPDAPHWEI